MDNMTGDSIGNTLQDFIHDFEIPAYLTFDGHQSQLGRGSLSMKTIRKDNIKYHVSSPRRPEQNPVEGGISEYVDFIFYDWVMYRANAGLGELSLGRR